MAHLGSNFASYETFLGQADNIWSVDLAALNSSGVTGQALLATNTEADGTRYLNVSITAEGLTPSQTHAQHVHGAFDEDGNPSDSFAPGLAQDTDLDGIVEVIEGVAAYGDILLPLTDLSSGQMPMTDANGQLTFIQSYDLGNDDLFFSAVTNTQYSAEDVFPLDLREIVLHGVDVPTGIGEGTMGEVDGTQDGYVPILPAAAGEIEMIDAVQAADILEDQREIASDEFVFGGEVNVFDAGAGNDTVRGGGGDDQLSGGGDGDFIVGGSGDDTVNGDAGNDELYGGTGDDVVNGGLGSDTVVGQDGNDALTGGGGSDLMTGGDGDDFINGGFGFDRIQTGEGNDKVYHAGVAGHGTDWIQDFDGDADVLIYGDSSASADDFIVSYAQTEGAGGTAAEAFVTHAPSGQIVWALVDGADEASLNVQIAGGEMFDLMA